MVEKIKKIIAKVRDMYKHNNQLNNLLKTYALVDLRENELGEIELRSIRFLYYNSLTITNKKITYKPEMRAEEVLIEYNGFDELLNL